MDEEIEDFIHMELRDKEGMNLSTEDVQRVLRAVDHEINGPIDEYFRKVAGSHLMLMEKSTLRTYLMGKLLDKLER